MAKGKSFFGLKRGSTKSLTFQVLNGQQIVKDRVVDVKNPRTVSQMSQRMIMATASAAYAAMRAIVNHSFEGVTYGQATMSEFIRENARLLAANLSAVTSKFAYNEYQNRNLVPGCYLVSRGSLPYRNFVEGVLYDPTYIAIDIYRFEEGSSSVSVANLAKSLGLAVGDYATIMIITKDENLSTYSFSYIRIKYIQSSDTIVTTSNITDFFEFESNREIKWVEVQNLSVVFGLKLIMEDIDMFLSTVVHSKKTSNGWLRSTAVFEPGQDIQFTPTAENALATYPVGTDYILNGGSV